MRGPERWVVSASGWKPRGPWRPRCVGSGLEPLSELIPVGCSRRTRGGERAGAVLQPSFVRRHASAEHRGSQAARESGSPAGARVTLHWGVEAGPTPLATPPCYLSGLREPPIPSRCLVFPVISSRNYRVYSVTSGLSHRMNRIFFFF